jgi:hypothetical protein
VEKYGTAGQARDGNIIRRIRFASWIKKTLKTHTQNMLTPTAFPRQQQLCERVLLFRFKLIASLVIFGYKYSRQTEETFCSVCNIYY